jgi:hypothetical protein
MFSVTADLLREEIAKMERVVLAHNGAIEFAQHLLAQLEERDAMPINDFAEMVAGNGAKVESIKAVD